jgi:hypothetical protein
MKKLLSILCLVAAGSMLLGVAGCGGGDDSSAASLTKKQFIKSAESICKQAESKQLKTATKYLQDHPGAEEEDVVVPAGLPPIEEELTKLEALGLPEGGEAEIEAFLEALQEGLDKANADPASVLVQKGNPFEEANEIGQKYGLKACASNP